MPRNNERTGVSDIANTGDYTPQEETKSILDFVLPTEFVDLPTGGKFYPPDHPLHNKESIEIRYMTAKDTDILTSKSLIKKGVAIDRMLQNIIVDNSIKVEELFLGDKNAILIAARINGFGAEYETKITCPACNNVSNFSFDLNEIGHSLEKEHDYNISSDGSFFVELPHTGVTVECKLLTGKDEKSIARLIQKKKKHNLPETLLTDQYKSFIVSINDVTERGQVEKFIDLMPARDSAFLRMEYNKVSPDVDMTHDYSCDNCDHEALISIPFSTEFFWPNR